MDEDLRMRGAFKRIFHFIKWFSVSLQYFGHMQGLIVCYIFYLISKLKVSRASHRITSCNGSSMHQHEGKPLFVYKNVVEKWGYYNGSPNGSLS